MTKGSHPDETEPSTAMDHRGDGDIVHDDEPPQIRTIGHIPVSREAFEANSITMLVEDRLAWSLDRTPPRRPTEAEARETYRRRTQEYLALMRAWSAFEGALEALAAVTDPLARKILDLHEPEERESWSSDGVVCTGCPSDCEEGPPHYPCETVLLVAEHFGVTISGPSDPRPTEPPTYQDPADWEPPKRIRDLFVEAVADIPGDSPILFGSTPPGT